MCLWNSLFSLFFLTIEWLMIHYYHLHLLQSVCEFHQMLFILLFLHDMEMLCLWQWGIVFCRSFRVCLEKFLCDVVGIGIIRCMIFDILDLLLHRDFKRKAMASAIGSRVESFRNSPLLRFSLNFLRASSSASFSTSSAVSSAQNPKKSKRRKKKNLFEVAQFLPNWGIGYHMAKSHWNEVSYEITKLNLYKVLLSILNFFFSCPSIVCIGFQVFEFAFHYYLFLCFSFFIFFFAGRKAWKSMGDCS